MTRKIWLDGHCESPVPPNARLIDSEVAFLAHVLGDESLFIQGPSLCQWARTLAEGRGWEYSEVGHPSRELRHACPGMTDGQAEELIERLSTKLWTLHRPVRPVDVAHSFWPSDIWLVPPGWSHAAHWLCWLIGTDFGTAESALLRPIAQRWEHESFGLLSRCYAAAGRDQALDVLAEWLGLARPRDRASWAPFPLETLPMPVRSVLAQRVRRETIASNGDSVRYWYKGGLSPEVGRLVAREAADYYRVHREGLRPEVVDLLAPYLPLPQMEQLRRLCSYEDPGPPPNHLSELVQWYRQRYLPWRTATLGSQNQRDLERARAIGRQFGEWYLQSYLQFVMASLHESPLSWARVAQVQQRIGDEVTLLVVLDGLGVRDLQALLNEINSVTARLTVEVNDIALAPIPTVTEFAKTAILRGLPPGQALIDESPAGVNSRLTSVLQAFEQARAGAPVIWRLVEPDRTYHQVQDQHELEPKVHAQLSSVARQLQHVIEQTPDEVGLRIVITTDHGRLLGLSSRTLAVPPECRAHGRAAWGKIERTFPQAGFVIEEHVAVLNAESFRLPPDANYVVALTDESFKMNDGRGGEEWFPHGGLFPEEVLVPWVELLRDARVQPLEVALTGGGEAGKEGRIQFKVMNANEFAVTIVLLRLGVDGLEREVVLDAEIEPRSPRSLEASISDWFSSEECGTVTARLSYRLPSGRIESQRIDDVRLTSEALYVKKNILEDLP